MQWTLIPFGYAFMVGCGLMIVVPFLRGRTDLLTTWNFFLFGSAIFVGGSSLLAGWTDEPYLDHSFGDYLLFYIGVVVFYVTLMLTYHLLPWPRRWAGRYFRKWPGQSIPVLSLLLPVCALLTAAAVFAPPIPGVKQALIQVGPSASLFALAFAFVAWWQQRANPILVCLLVAAAVYALVFSMVGQTGRRDLIATLLVLPVSLYWLKLRYWKPGKTLALVLVLGILATMIISGYTSVRHRARGEGREALSYSHVIRSLALIPQNMLTVDLRLLGQNATAASLVSIHLHTRTRDPEPFAAFVFVVTNPIPRQLWQDKPLGLGYTLPKTSGLAGGRENWGPGIVGHGYHEGGPHMLIFYGLLVGSFLRFSDELMRRQPTNPFLIGMFCGMAAQVMGWPRGDIGVFSVQIVNAIVTGLILAIIGRIFSGTQVEYPRELPTPPPPNALPAWGR